MATLKLSDRMIHNKDPEDAFCDKKEKEYNGVFYGDNQDKKYYEGGAHFSYKELHKRLNDLIQTFYPTRFEKELNVNEKILETFGQFDGKANKIK